MRVRALLPWLLLAAPAVAEAPSKEPASSTSPPQLELNVRESGTHKPWQFTVTNRGTMPVQLVADPRLLWFDVKVPGKRSEQTCRLPSNLFPSRAAARSRMVLRPGEGVEHAFDPRLYCFAAGGQWRLVPGALISPHYGWPEKTKTRWKNGKRLEEPLAKQSPPYVARSIAEADDANLDDEEVGQGDKQLDATPFALRSEYAKWAKTRLEEDRKDKRQPPLTLELSQGSDAHAERTAMVSIKLKNRSKRHRYIYFRREMVSFEVMGPDGLTTCDSEPDIRAPERHSFSRVRSGSSMTIQSRLVELCPRGTFGRPGLYLVHARLDATRDGSDWDLDAFTGRIFTETPGTVRIRTGELPFQKRTGLRRVRHPRR